MDHANVPPALANVVESLREANEYARLQLQRQRGVYNLLTGFPGLFFALMFGNAASLVDLDLRIPITALAWILFFVSCLAPKSLLSVIRRRRPDWESPLVDSYLLTKALEKQFWLQVPVVMSTWVLLPLLMAVSFLTDLGPFWLLVASGQMSILVVCAGALALQARRQQDRLLERLFWLVAILAPLWLLVIAPSQFSGPSFALFGLSIVVPPLAAGLYRLLAPRGWLRD